MNQHKSNQGYVLITSVIFLSILAFVAVTALKNTSMELRMAGNSVEHKEAFEASELPRSITSELVDVTTFNRGWPQDIGGEIPDNLFDYIIPNGITILDIDTDGEPERLDVNNSEAAFDPLALDTDIEYTRNLAGPSQTEYQVTSNVGVYKIATKLMTGGNPAAGSGTKGIGKGAAGAGAAVYYLVHSQGEGANGSMARAQTSNIYRSVIRN